MSIAFDLFYAQHAVVVVAKDSSLVFRTSASGATAKPAQQDTAQDELTDHLEQWG